MGDNLDNITDGQAPNEENLVDTDKDDGELSVKLERYKQQIEGSRQEALTQRQERINDWTESLELDKTNLNRLAKVKDTKLVNEVLSYFNYSSIDEALEEAGLLEDSSGGMTKEQLEKWYEERKSKDIHQIALSEAEKSFSDLSEDEQKKAKANFEKITKGKILTIDEAKEYADMAALYAMKDKVIKKGDQGQGLVNLASLGNGSQKPGQKDKDLIDSVLENW